MPFLAADAGNFLGGGISSYLIGRGVSVGTARKLVIAVGGLGMSSLVISLALNELGPLAACFAVATCSYAALSTMVLNLPADLYHPRAVASVSGFSGTGAGLGTIAATLGIGVVTDHYSFAPVLVVASIAPLLAVVAVLTLVRNTAASGDGLLRRDLTPSGQQSGQDVRIDQRGRCAVEIERRPVVACAGSRPARPA